MGEIQLVCISAAKIAGKGNRKSIAHGLILKNALLNFQNNSICCLKL